MYFMFLSPTATGLAACRTTDYHCMDRCMYFMFLSLTATGLAACRTTDYHCMDRRSLLHYVPFSYSNWLGSLSDY